MPSQPVEVWQRMLSRCKYTSYFSMTYCPWRLFLSPFHALVAAPKCKHDWAFACQNVMSESSMNISEIGLHDWHYCALMAVFIPL